MRPSSIAEAQHDRTGDEALRARLHGMWASVAAGWAEHADYIDERGTDLAGELLELVAPRPGERVLELACGPGGVGLAAARRVAPGGEVVLSDVAAEMTEIASQRAAAQALANVRTRVLDLEQINEPGGAYDVVLCREGLMFAADPARAAREIHRMLRPDGRVALAVWGPRAHNPWLGLVFDAVGAELGTQIPPPGIPGPFSLGSRDRLVSILTDAGLTGVAVREFAVPLRAGSFDEWWTRTSTLAGPLAKILTSLPEQAVEAIRVRLREAIRPYQKAGVIELPGLSLVASARRG